MTQGHVMPAEAKFGIEALSFASAVTVLPSQDRVKASRFAVPIPAFAGNELRYPERYPADMRNRDGSPHAQAGRPHSKEGQPLEDWEGRPVLNPDGSVPCGVVFFNYEDGQFQGVQSTGDKILLFNRPSPAQARQLEKSIAGLGGPAALTSVERITAVLEFAQGLGLDDRYDSSRAYAERSLIPVAEAVTGIPAYGLHVRVQEMVRAVFVPGPAQAGNLCLGPEGGVFLLVGTHPETGTREIRPVSPGAFAGAYLARDGRPIAAGDLPQERPWISSGSPPPVHPGNPDAPGSR